MLLIKKVVSFFTITCVLASVGFVDFAQASDFEIEQLNINGISVSDYKKNNHSDKINFYGELDPYNVGVFDQATDLEIKIIVEGTGELINQVFPMPTCSKGVCKATVKPASGGLLTISLHESGRLKLSGLKLDLVPMAQDVADATVSVCDLNMGLCSYARVQVPKYKENPSVVEYRAKK